MTELVASGRKRWKLVSAESELTSFSISSVKFCRRIFLKDFLLLDGLHDKEFGQIHEKVSI
jgi:hypothetical protein